GEAGPPVPTRAALLPHPHNFLAPSVPNCYPFLDIPPRRAARPSLSVGSHTFPRHNALRVPGADSGSRLVHERCDDVVADPLPLQGRPPAALPQGEPPAPGGRARVRRGRVVQPRLG